MGSMDSYSKAAMERAMKVQEVILRAMAKKITWWQAAEIIGISDRHISPKSISGERRPASAKKVCARIAWLLNTLHFILPNFEESRVPALLRSGPLAASRHAKVVFASARNQSLLGICQRRTTSP